MSDISRDLAKILAFSNAIASATDKYVLGAIIGEQLNDLFGIYEYCIYINSRDGRWSWPYIFDVDTQIARQPEFQSWIDAPNDLNDDLHRYVKSAQDVILLDLEGYLSLPGAARYRPMMESIGMKGWGCHTIRLPMSKWLF